MASFPALLPGEYSILLAQLYELARFLIIPNAVRLVECSAQDVDNEMKLFPSRIVSRVSL